MLTGPLGSVPPAMTPSTAGVRGLCRSVVAECVWLFVNVCGMFFVCVCVFVLALLCMGAEVPVYSLTV